MAITRSSGAGFAARLHGSFAGKAVDLGVVADPFLAALLAGADTGIKKPGIPADAPAWLKTMMEIVLGRRGNAVPIPARETLTFSASPTKAECEALYAYVNKIQGALDQIITRFDS
jgi:hypothetical protein